MTLLQNLISEDFGLEGRGKWFHSQEHDSMVYNADDDYFFWNSQNIRGGALEYLIYVRGMEKSEARNFLNNYFGAFKENPESLKAKPYDKLISLMWESGKNNRKYWYDRCLKDETIDRYQLGYYNEWYLVPLYRDGEFENFQMRREEPKKAITQWYRGGKALPLYNEGILPYLENKTVYITEGTVDAILLNQEGFPCVSPNGTNTWQQDWFSKFSKIKEIIYIADYDKAGMNGASLVAKSLGMGRVRIVTFDDKPEKYDSVDFFKEHKSKELFKEWIDTHSHYLFELEIVYGRTKDIGKYRKEFSWAK